MLKKLVELVADIVHEFGKLLKFGLGQTKQITRIMNCPMS